MSNYNHKFLDKTSAVNSVIVAAPSSKERPLAKVMLKLLISRDFFLTESL